MKRSNKFVLKVAGGKFLLVPIGRKIKNPNGLIILNDVARYIWEILSVEISIDEIAIAVSEEFDIDLDSAKNDAQHFLREIDALGMLSK